MNITSMIQKVQSIEIEHSAEQFKKVTVYTQRAAKLERKLNCCDHGTNLDRSSSSMKVNGCLSNLFSRYLNSIGKNDS